PGHEGPVSENAAVANAAIVGDMAIHHEIVVIADHRLPRMSCAAVNRDVLAEDVAVANLCACLFIVVLHVLRALTEDGSRMDGIASAHGQRTAKISMRTNDAAATDPYRTFDHGIGADVNVFGQNGLWGNDRRGVNAIGGRHGRIPTAGRWGG